LESDVVERGECQKAGPNHPVDLRNSAGGDDDGKNHQQRKGNTKKDLR